MQKSLDLSKNILQDLRALAAFRSSPFI